VRAVALAALVAAALFPLLRRRLRIPAPATTAAVASGPFALAVLRPRSKARDAVLFALQMWAFVVAHELPYDDPERLRRRLRIHYPIRVDRILGGGKLPGARLQRVLRGGEDGGPLDRPLAWAHWLWFFEPHLAMTWILVRHNERFAHAARQMAATYDLGCAAYAGIPTAPPWWASEQGQTGEDVSRVMIEVGESTFGRAWPRLYESLGGNPWAAMPSLHFGTSVMAAILLAECGTGEGAAGFAYAGVLGFALVYLGEHYVIDLIAGLALVAAVRNGEPLVEPLAGRISRAVQRLERLANS
jgi:PAP2 superfamily protein